MSKDTSMKRNITLKVIPNTFGRDSMADIKIVYSVQNNVSYPIQYGSRYKIERYTDSSRWELVPFIDNLAFEDIIYSLKPGNSQELTMGIPKILKNKPVKTGLYRMIKEVWPVEKKDEKETLITEFTIE